MTQEKQQSPTNHAHLIDAYGHMLQRAEAHLADAARMTGSGLIQALHGAKEKAVELGELSREEAETVHDFISRDLYDAGHYLATGERELSDWLRLNTLLVEKKLLKRFSTLAEAARLEIRHLEKAQQRFSEWHTGEITTIGTLRCAACGELIHFEQTGRIPPCPKCHHTVFVRVKAT